MKYLILLFLISACGRFPTKENVEAFNRGDQGYITLDVSDVNNAVYELVFKKVQAKLNKAVHHDCFKRNINAFRPDLLQGFPYSFVRENIKSSDDAYRYYSSQTISPKVYVQTMDRIADSNTNGVIVYKDKLIQSEDIMFITLVTAHEISHYLGFSHNDINNKKSFPVVAGESASIGGCASL